MFATPRWCLGSTHLPARVTSDDESVGSAGEGASRERGLPDCSQSSTAAAPEFYIEARAIPVKQEPRPARECCSGYSRIKRHAGGQAPGSRRGDTLTAHAEP